MAASKNVSKKRLGRGLNSLLSSTRLKDLTESEPVNSEEIAVDPQSSDMGLPSTTEGADATDLGKGKSGRNVVVVEPGTGDLKTKSGTGAGSEGRSLSAGNGETISGDSGLGKVKKSKKVSGRERVKNAAGRGVEGAEVRKFESGKGGLGEEGIRGSNQHSALRTSLEDRKQESGVRIKEGRKGLGIGDGDAVIEKVVGEKVGGIKSSGLVMGEIAIELIARNPHQPRQHWDDEKLGALAESIKVNGIIQPVLVRAVGDRYQLIAGERRLRAAAMAGLAGVPAIVRDASEEQMMEWALVENIHRSDLNAMERARAYREYIRRFSLTQEAAAVHLGEDRSTIANYMRLLELP